VRGAGESSLPSLSFFFPSSGLPSVFPEDGGAIPVPMASGSGRVLVDPPLTPVAPVDEGLLEPPGPFVGEAVEWPSLPSPLVEFLPGVRVGSRIVSAG
jgi:hypothetical protein